MELKISEVKDPRSDDYATEAADIFSDASKMFIIHTGYEPFGKSIFCAYPILGKEKSKREKNCVGESTFEENRSKISGRRGAKTITT